MADTDSSRTKPKKEIKRKLASIERLQAPCDKNIGELTRIASSISDHGLASLLSFASYLEKAHPIKAEQNSVILSMTEWRAAKSKVTA